MGKINMSAEERKQLEPKLLLPKERPKPAPLPTKPDALDFTEGQHASLDAATGVIKKIWAIIEKQNLDDIRVENSKDIYNLANSISGLAKVIEGIERSARERKHLQAGAKEDLINAVRHELKQHPELVKEFLEVIEKTSRQLSLSD